MKAVIRRVARLEVRFAPAARTPRQCFRTVVRRLDSPPSLQGATCTRTLMPDGTLYELVRLDRSHPDSAGATDEEIEEFIANVPIAIVAAGSGGIP